MGAEIRTILIDGYPIDVAKMETHSLEADVTEHPVEKGSTITDHVRLNPIEVTLECLVSDTPIGSIAVDPTRINSQIEIEGESSTAVPTPSEDAYARLKAIRLAREPVTIETSLDRFENMVLTRLTIPRSADTSGGLTFEATFREIVIVENLRVTVRVADPRGNKKTDFGLKSSDFIDGKEIVWNIGLPPGTDAHTFPLGIIIGTEIVIVKPAQPAIGTDEDLAFAQITKKVEFTYDYFHKNTGQKLTLQEVRNLTKDLQRDAANVKKTQSQTTGLKSELSRADALLKDKKNPGSHIDPSLFKLNH